MDIKNSQYPIKKAHYVGTSIVITLDPTHVKRLNIDELTFFVQKPFTNGIILEMHKIDAKCGSGVKQEVNK